MAGITVFFTREQGGTASDVMRRLQVGYGDNTVGYAFDGVEYTADHSLARLTRGPRVFHVPTRHILMIVGDAEDQ